MRSAARQGSARGCASGTASVRRRAQLLALEPTVAIEPLRGNIDTRLRKRGERGLDAVVLAACGLDRLGAGGEIGYRFDPEELLPEAGQGALALQVRAGKRSSWQRADDGETRQRVEAERRCVALRRRRVSGTGCRLSRRCRPARAGRRRGRSWIERRSGDDPDALAQGARRGSGSTGGRRERMTRIVVTRAGGAGRRARPAARGRRLRGRRLSR